MDVHFRCVRNHRVPTVLGLFMLLWALGFWADFGAGPGLAFALPALVVLGFRVVCRADSGAAEMRVQWSLFGIPLLTRQRVPTASIRAVELRRERRRRGSRRKSSYEVFPVRLKGDTALTLREPGDFGKARVFAERVAEQLGLPLHDYSSGRLRKRTADELQLTLGQRLRKRGRQPPQPAPPTNARVRFRDRGARKQLMLPAQPLPWWGYLLALAIPAVLFAVFWLGGERVVAVVIVLPVALFFYVRLLASLFPARLEFDPDGVRVRALLYRKEMPFSALEEAVQSRSGIYLLSDRQRLGLPYDFTDDEEARFVIDLIEYLAWSHPSSAPATRG
jgi:hypothetical protein